MFIPKKGHKLQKVKTVSGLMKVSLWGKFHPRVGRGSKMSAGSFVLIALTWRDNMQGGREMEGGGWTANAENHKSFL